MIIIDCKECKYKLSKFLYLGGQPLEYTQCRLTGIYVIYNNNEGSPHWCPLNNTLSIRMEDIVI